MPQVYCIRDLKNLIPLPPNKEKNIHGITMWYSRFTKCWKIYLI
jgi:hypothetical protein